MWYSRPDAILNKASHAEEVQPSGRQTPWFGRSDLIMEIACSRSAIVRTLGQHRLDILWYFDHNFLLKYRIGQNWHHWKANKNLCNLMVWTANRNVWTAHRSYGKIVASEQPAKIQEVFRIAFQTQKQLTVQTPKSTVRTRVPKTPILRN
jgi:hypothetical protein